MKKKFIYLLPLLLVIITGCAKSYHDPATDPDKYGYPLGTFAGNFTRVHKNHKTYKYDTSTTTLRLVLSTNTGFMVSGDTATVHAGSYGSFSEDFVNMEFNDVTYPVNYKPQKAHLSGYYTYTYTGNYLEIVSGLKSDTLKDTYYLTKIN